MNVLKLKTRSHCTEPTTRVTPGNSIFIFIHIQSHVFTSRLQFSRKAIYIWKIATYNTSPQFYIVFTIYYMAFTV
jgi:hypothetical protein